MEGTVVHAVTKEPVRKAHVVLELSEGAHDTSLVATTDEAGRFRFADVKAGEYKLSAEKNGFLEGFYGGTKPEEEGSLLRVAGGSRMRDLTLLLFPGATIRGQVLDRNGDPSPETQVVLWVRYNAGGQTKNGHAGESKTDQSGGYFFGSLAPGTYYVAADPGNWGNSVRQIPVDSSGKTTKLHDLITFYPTALSLADAQGVSLESGQEQSGVDIRIQQGSTLSVKGRVAGISGSASKYQLSARVDEGIGWTSEAATILPSGDFVFAELPPGKRRLTLLGSGPSGFQTIGRTEVNLTDQDLTGVVITPFKPAQVRVRVVMEGEGEDHPLTTGTVFLTPTEGAADAGDHPMQYQPQNGVYVMDDVPPGRYRAWFNTLATATSNRFNQESECSIRIRSTWEMGRSSAC